MSGNEGLYRSQSDTAVLCLKRDAYLPTRHFTEGDLTTRRANRSSSGQRVRFSDQLRVVLVPTRSEYAARGLSHDVWYTQEDYASFKTSARNEIMEFLNRGTGGGVKHAINELYQSMDTSPNAMDDVTGLSTPPPPGTQDDYKTSARDERAFRRQGSNSSTASNESTTSADSSAIVESPIDVISKSNLHPNHGYVSSLSSGMLAHRPAPVVHPLALMV